MIDNEKYKELKKRYKRLNLTFVKSENGAYYVKERSFIQCKNIDFFYDKLNNKND